MTSSRTSDALLALTRLGLGNTGEVLSEAIDWSELKALAEQHGLSAIVLDGIDCLPESKRPPKDFLLQWIGEVLHDYEQRYDIYCRTIAEMAGFYNNHGFKMMVLKGYACSLDWPNPKHRPCGDIDIWLFGRQEEADALLAKEKVVKIDTSEHHHTVFYWKDFMVENHYDFINVHHHRSNVEIEKILKDLGRDDSHYVELYGEKIYLPSPNLHAFFLLKHTMMHFAAEGIMLRQVIDWGIHAKSHSMEIDWDWLEGVMKRYGMLEMYSTLNAICVENLGFDSSFFPKAQFNPYTKDQVLNEIISPKFGTELPKCFLPRFIFKFRRWSANEWKHRLCYKESMWSAFCTGVKSHLMKPSSI